MNATNQFHIGIVVDDFDAALEELGGLFGYEWCPVFAIETPVVLPDGEIMLDLRFAYSKTQPRVEIIRAVAGTPWVPAPGAGIHHAGYWSDDLAGGGRRAAHRVGRPGAAGWARAVLGFGLTRPERRDPATALSPVGSGHRSKVAFQHLPGRITRQSLEERDVLRHLVLRQLPGAVRDQLLSCHGLTLAQDDEGHGDLAPPFVRPSHHGGFQHGTMLVKDALDL